MPREELGYATYLRKLVPVVVITIAEELGLAAFNSPGYAGGHGIAMRRSLRDVAPGYAEDVSESKPGSHAARKTSSTSSAPP